MFPVTVRSSVGLPSRAWALMPSLSVWLMALPVTAITPSALPRMSTRMPRPSAEPDPDTAGLPIVFPAIVPLSVQVVQLEPANTWIAFDVCPDISALFDTSKVAVEASSAPRSTATLLFWKTLPVTVTCWAELPRKLVSRPLAWLPLTWVPPCSRTVTSAVPEPRIVIPLPPVPTALSLIVLPEMVRSRTPAVGVNRTLSSKEPLIVVPVTLQVPSRFPKRSPASVPSAVSPLSVIVLPTSEKVVTPSPEMPLPRLSRMSM